MRPKHVEGNKYSIVKYNFVVATANLTISAWMVTRLWIGNLRNWDSIPDRDKGLLFSLHRPDLFLVPASFLFSGKIVFFFVFFFREDEATADGG
jgi:hypothetical protein